MTVSVVTLGEPDAYGCVSVNVMVLLPVVANVPEMVDPSGETTMLVESLDDAVIVDPGVRPVMVLDHGTFWVAVSVVMRMLPSVGGATGVQTDSEPVDASTSSRVARSFSGAPMFTAVNMKLPP